MGNPNFNSQSMQRSHYGQSTSVQSSMQQQNSAAGYGQGGNPAYGQNYLSADFSKGQRQPHYAAQIGSSDLNNAILENR
jgi:hypothetical protein